MKISEQIHGIAWPSIVDARFLEQCPNFSSDPQAPLKLIKQTIKDENGGTVTLAGHEYYRCFQLAASALMTESQLKLDLTGTFLNGLDTCIRNKICAIDPDEGAVCSRNTDKRIKELCSLLQLITSAETDIKSTGNIVKDAIKLSKLTKRRAKATALTNVGVADIFSLMLWTIVGGILFFAASLAPTNIFQESKRQPPRSAKPMVVTTCFQRRAEGLATCRRRKWMMRATLLQRQPQLVYGTRTSTRITRHEFCQKVCLLCANLRFPMFNPPYGRSKSWRASAGWE